MTLRNIAHNGIILGGFPGRYTRPKTGIFPRSQYELSALQIFVLRHIARIAPLRSRDCPISRLSLTFTHGEFSQKFFANFSQVAPHSPRRIRTFLSESAELRKTLFMLPSEEIFPKNFSQKIPENHRLFNSAQILHSEEIFPKNFFQKFWALCGDCGNLEKC